MSTRMTALSFAVTAGLCLAHAANVSASTLSFEDLATGLNGAAPVTGTATSYTSLPVTDLFGNSFSCSACASQVLVSDAGNSFNFYDDYVFTVASSTIDAVSSTINLGKFFEINNLQMRLYTDPNTATTVSTPLPVLGNSPPGLKSGNPANGGWSSPINYSLGGSSNQISVLDDIMLGQGTYVLEIRGDVVGAAGGNYAGALHLSPVPIPAALPLMLSGLGLLGGLVRKRFAS
jgi:hypothetical protein